MRRNDTPISEAGTEANINFLKSAIAQKEAELAEQIYGLQNYNE